VAPSHLDSVGLGTHGIGCRRSPNSLIKVEKIKLLCNYVEGNCTKLRVRLPAASAKGTSVGWRITDEDRIKDRKKSPYTVTVSSYSHHLCDALIFQRICHLSSFDTSPLIRLTSCRRKERAFPSTFADRLCRRSYRAAFRSGSCSNAFSPSRRRGLC